ncbi:MAG: PepSY domain-containing protein [Rhodocyclaceae bacterium]|nr:PepSY domain-containing protein [Rhodocyclaceae bacterium]MBR4737570.1 PepSY domain-containing protein [Rhodocyclaceae bacterium]
MTHTALFSLRRACAGAVLLCLLIAPLSADDDDYLRASEAVRAGEILPMEQVLARLAKQYPGNVLEVELEDDDDDDDNAGGRRWLYEVKLLQPDGQLRKVLIDAKTGEVLHTRVKHRHRHGSH